MKKKLALILLCALGLLNAQDAEPNLVRNPNFEVWNFGGPVGWYGENILEDAEQKASGEKSAKIYANVRNENTMSQYSIPVTPGAVYMLSYKVLDVAPRTSLWSNMIWFSDNDKVLSRVSGTRSKDNENWQAVTQELAVPAGATKATLQFRVARHRAGNTDQIYINVDDVVLVKKTGELSTTEAEKLREEIKISNTRVSNSFTLSLKGDALVSIINMGGRQVLSEKVNNSHTFDVSSLPKGVYIVVIKKDQNLVSKKIIVQ